LLAPPARAYGADVEREPGRLRVAFSTRSPLGTTVDAAAIAAVERTARLLEELGHQVEPAEPDIDGVALAQDFLRIWFAQLAHQIRTTRTRWGVRSRDFELDSLAMEVIARARRAPDYVASYVRWLEYGFRLQQFLAHHDVYMTPTLAQPPPRIGAISTPRWAKTLMRPALSLGLGALIPLANGTIEKVSIENLRGVPFTQLANVTGVPAMSVPLCTFPNGLPLGIHFLADHGGEGRLLSLAGQLERAAPWHARRPDLA
jgi:amidase